jgi:hypothetical protein
MACWPPPLRYIQHCDCKDSYGRFKGTFLIRKVGIDGPYGIFPALQGQMWPVQRYNEMCYFVTAGTDMAGSKVHVALNPPCPSARSSRSRGL